MYPTSVDVHVATTGQRRTGVLKAAPRAPIAVGYASFMALISNSRVTFSPTRTPPDSSGAFQLRPQSLRLMTTEPSKPRRMLP